MLVRVVLIALVVAACGPPAAKPAPSGPSLATPHAKVPVEHVRESVPAPAPDTSGPRSTSSERRLPVSVGPASRGTGAIQGVVTDTKTQQKLAGVTVIVTSPAFAEVHTAMTDATGSFKIGELPTGDYLVTFYYADVTVERSGVHVGVDKSTPVFQSLNSEAAGGPVIHVRDTAPTIDTLPARVDDVPPICVYLHNCGS